VCPEDNLLRYLMNHLWDMAGLAFKRLYKTRKKEVTLLISTKL